MGREGDRGGALWVVPSSEGGYGINIQVEKYDNREIHGMRFKSTILDICG